MIFNAELTNDQKNLDLNYSVFRYLEENRNGTSQPHRRWD